MSPLELDLLGARFVSLGYALSAYACQSTITVNGCGTRFTEAPIDLDEVRRLAAQAGLLVDELRVQLAFGANAPTLDALRMHLAFDGARVELTHWHERDPQT